MRVNKSFPHSWGNVLRVTTREYRLRNREEHRLKSWRDMWRGVFLAGQGGLTWPNHAKDSRLAARCSALLIANSRSTFDSGAHFYCGETTSLTLPAAIPAYSLVYLGPDLVLARFTFKGIFSVCFIPSTMDTSKREKAPVGLCGGHKGLLAPGGHGATVSSFTEGLRIQAEPWYP